MATSDSSISSSSESDDEVESDTSDDEELIEMIALWYLTQQNMLPSISGAKRTRNVTKRVREHHLNEINKWSDSLFKRQFRLSREDFEILLKKIILHLFFN